MAQNNTLATIRARAKKLRSSHKNMGWIAAIKKASKELKSEGKIGKVKKAPQQTKGTTSNEKLDRLIKAKAPGKRTVKHGRKTKVHYEYRKNRTDMPGKLTGIKTEAKNKLAKALLDYELADTIKGTKAARERIVKFRKIYRSL